MIGILLSLFVGLIVFLGVGRWLPWWQALPPALGAVAASYVALYRAMRLRFETIIKGALSTLEPLHKEQKHLDWDAKQRKEIVEEALVKLRDGYQLSGWLFRVYPEIDNHIGRILYSFLLDLDGAKDFLERSAHHNWRASVTLALIYLRRGEHGTVESLFEQVLHRHGKTDLIWLLYADALLRTKRADKATEVLRRGRDMCPANPQLIDNLVALENGKKLKLREFSEQWDMFWPDESPELLVTTSSPHREGRVINPPSSTPAPITGETSAFTSDSSPM